MAVNPIRNSVAGIPQGGGGFNSLAAGRKRYGGGRSMPNVGRGGAQAAAGYNERDVMANARREALLRRAAGRS